MQRELDAANKVFKEYERTYAQYSSQSHLEQILHPYRAPQADMLLVMPGSRRRARSTRRCRGSWTRPTSALRSTSART